MSSSHICRSARSYTGNKTSSSNLYQQEQPNYPLSGRQQKDPYSYQKQHDQKPYDYKNAIFQEWIHKNNQNSTKYHHNNLESKLQQKRESPYSNNTPNEDLKYHKRHKSATHNPTSQIIEKPEKDLQQYDKYKGLPPKSHYPYSYYQSTYQNYPQNSILENAKTLDLKTPIRASSNNNNSQTIINKMSKTDSSFYPSSLQQQQNYMKNYQFESQKKTLNFSSISSKFDHYGVRPQENFSSIENAISSSSTIDPSSQTNSNRRKIDTNLQEIMQIIEKMYCESSKIKRKLNLYDLKFEESNNFKNIIKLELNQLQKHIKPDQTKQDQAITEQYKEKQIEYKLQIKEISSQMAKIEKEQDLKNHEIDNLIHENQSLQSQIQAQKSKISDLEDQLIQEQIKGFKRKDSEISIASSIAYNPDEDNQSENQTQFQLKYLKLVKSLKNITNIQQNEDQNPENLLKTIENTQKTHNNLHSLLKNLQKTNNQSLKTYLQSNQGSVSLENPISQSTTTFINFLKDLQTFFASSSSLEKETTQRHYKVLQNHNFCKLMEQQLSSFTENSTQQTEKSAYISLSSKNQELNNEIQAIISNFYQNSDQKNQKQENKYQLNDIVNNPKTIIKMLKLELSSLFQTLIHKLKNLDFHALSLPNKPLILTQIIQEFNQQEIVNFRQTLRLLDTQKIINYSKDNGEIQITLTKKFNLVLMELKDLIVDCERDFILVQASMEKAVKREYFSLTNLVEQVTQIYQKSGEKSPCKSQYRGILQNNVANKQTVQYHLIYDYINQLIVFNDFYLLSLGSNPLIN